MFRNYGLEFIERNEKFLNGLLSDVIYFGDAKEGNLLYKQKNYGDVIAAVTWRETEENMVEICDYAFWPRRAQPWQIKNNGMFPLEDGDKVFLHIGQKEERLAVRMFHTAQCKEQSSILQLMAYPILIDYYQKQPVETDQTRVIPLGRILYHSRKNRRSRGQSEQEVKENLPYEAVLLKGKVAQIRQERVVFSKSGLVIPYYCCMVETKVGPLSLIHTMQEVRCGTRSTMKAGAVVFAKCLLYGRLLNE